MVRKTKVCVITLGCPKNTVDSEHLLAQLDTSTYEILPEPDDAEIVVINTCGFIQDAKEESIDTILEAVERKREGCLKRVIVMGCLSQRYRTELQYEIPEVDAYFGTEELPDVVRFLKVDYKPELRCERYITTPKHFAYLKISEGCNHPCSFCAIPLIRGKYRSVPREIVVHEARRLAEKGVKELILIAQDTTSYGIDLYGTRELPSLVRELNMIDGIEWIRLLYTYPGQFPLELIDVFHSCDKLCHYLDIPIQHISDSVLRSMQRGISARATKELLYKLKTEIPDIALRTTLMVGYPTETNDDFQQLYDFVGEMQFHRLGVFTYSQEEGTTAYELGDPIPQEVKNQRHDALMILQREISLRRNETLVGTQVRIMIDEVNKGYAIGRTSWDAPEIDQEVMLYSTSLPTVGSIIPVKIVSAAEYDLEARLIEKSSEDTIL
ncbi:MAG: 30S ribosomal protein S12 methylthiotransferase RimO [Bacteroidetes bacterium]|nr:30S ribosomal protein S12 methylthiotransferase RimO [Bacteroidota bacterium]